MLQEGDVMGLWKFQNDGITYVFNVYSSGRIDERMFYSIALGHFLLVYHG